MNLGQRDSNNYKFNTKDLMRHYKCLQRGITSVLGYKTFSEGSL
jgi:hypothetical protein